MQIKDGPKLLVTVTGHAMMLDSFDVEQFSILEQDLALLTGLRFFFEWIPVEPKPNEPLLPLEG